MSSRPNASGPERLTLEVCLEESTEAPGPLFDHLTSTLVAGVNVRRGRPPHGEPVTDVLWLERAPGSRTPSASEVLEAASRGALVVIREPELLGQEPARSPLSSATFPSVRPALLPLQRLLSRLLEALDAKDQGALFGAADAATVRLEGAEPLVLGERGALCALLPHGAGQILFLGLCPSLEGAGFRVESHLPVRAAAWQLLVDAVLAHAFARKHGVAVSKLLGPYGAGMMSWQAHVEESGGIWNEAMLQFVNRLAASRQVPSFALIRNFIRWGFRTPGLVHLPGLSAGLDSVHAQPEGPAFFSGHWVLLEDGSEPGFKPDERYVEYYAPTEGLPRTYPAPAPGGGLAIGTPDGRIELFGLARRGPHVALTRRGPLVLGDGTALRLSGPVAPTFGTGRDGRQHLVVADEHGTLQAYVNDGTGWAPTQRHEAGGPVSPRLVDWTGSGALDLLLGREGGDVELVEDFELHGLARRSTLFSTPDRRPAPFPVVSGGERKILVGCLGGRLWLWAGGSLQPLRSDDFSILDSHEPLVQQDAVPVVLEWQGERLLLVGASIVGVPHDEVRDGVRTSERLRETVARLLKGHHPLSAHLFLMPRMTEVDVALELDRHRDHFLRLGIPWKELGANQHCWSMPRGVADLSFLLQRAAGFCFNSGWQTPSTKAAPDKAPEFSLCFPFLHRFGQTRTDFLLFGPLLPDRYPRARELMARAGLPCTFFIHPEYRHQGKPGQETDGWIADLEELRRRHTAVFLTETRMAKAITAALTSTLEVVRDESGALRVNRDGSRVPEWASEYRDTVAVRVWSPETVWSSDAAVQRSDEEGLITLVQGSVRLAPGEPRRAPWRVSAANVPLSIREGGIEVLSPGFQEVHVRGRDLELQWAGAHIRDTEDGYVLTRFGERGFIRVRPLPASNVASASLAWSSHDSKQDQWLLHSVFRGRKTPGFFVETGAADGVSASATLVLERSFGWGGILVEPNDKFFEQMKKNRRCLLENACIAEKTGTIEFIEASWFGRIREHVIDELPGGEHRDHPYLGKDLDGSAAQVSRKPALSLRDLLVKHRAPRVIDFMSIDAEWSEWFILRAFPFREYQVLALCVHAKFRWEGRLVDSEHAEDIRRLMLNQGYFYDRERSRHVEHDFYVHPKLVTPGLPDMPLANVEPPPLWRRGLDRVRSGLEHLASVRNQLDARLRR